MEIELVFKHPLEGVRVFGLSTSPIGCQPPHYLRGICFLTMSGQIHRFKKERDYVNLDTHALRNQSLSWKAKGLHSYLLQLPDNWQINIADLANRSKDGRDGTAAGLTELIEAGYIIRQRVLNEKKQFEGWDYNVFEQPKQADDWKSENGKSVNGFAEN